MQTEGVFVVAKRSGRGRPKRSEPSEIQFALKGTASMGEWVDGLVMHARQGTRALLIKNALYEFARAHGYKPPMPER